MPGLYPLGSLQSITAFLAIQIQATPFRESGKQYSFPYKNVKKAVLLSIKRFLIKISQYKDPVP